MALTITFSLIISLFVAVALIPVLSSRLLERDTVTATQKDPSRKLLNQLLVWRRKNVFTRLASIPLFLGYLILWPFLKVWKWLAVASENIFADRVGPWLERSEERRVGKECVDGW